MIHESLKGTGVAIVTPFNDDASIDYKGLEKLVTHITEKGVDYIVVHGTTGETATLSNAEKCAILDFVIDINAGRLPIVLGHGGNNTQQLIEDLKVYNLEKVDALLSVSPYYNKPSMDGIYAHYQALSSATDLPLILYNVPARTGANMTAAVTVRLANDFDNIIGIKEASGDLSQVSNIIQNTPADFLVISGDDALALPIIAIGGDGVISVVANAWPEEIAEMINAALGGDFELAQTFHYILNEAFSLLFADGNPGGVKVALKELGIGSNNLRLPLIRVNSVVEAAIIAYSRNLVVEDEVAEL